MDEQDEAGRMAWEPGRVLALAVSLANRRSAIDSPRNQMSNRITYREKKGGLS